MFPDFSPSTSLGSRASGIVLGSIILMSATACVVSAKTMQLSFPLLFVASVCAALIARQIWRLRPVLSTSAVCLIIFLLYAAASSLWAARPSQALFTAALAGAITLASFVVAHFFRTEPAAVQGLRPIADELSLTPAQLAIAWVLANDNVAAALVGASRPEQVTDNVKASGVTIPPELLTRIDEVLAGVVTDDPALTAQSSPKARLV